jgi:hypothetical protein
MVRSPGFGSNACNSSPYSDSVSLRLRLFTLTSLQTLTRRLILQQARYHTINSALTACKHTVSGLFHSASHCSFHLSVTVLVHYRLRAVFSLGRWSSQIHTEFLVLRTTREQHQETHTFRLRGYHTLWPSFPAVFNYI